MVAQELLGVLAALTDALASKTEPGPRLLHCPALRPQIDDVAFAADALAVENVELDLPEGRRHLVLHHFDARPVADDLVAVLERPDPANVHADARVKLQRV